MRKLLLSVLLLSAAACTTYPEAMHYRPRNSNAAPYVITSSVNEITNEVTVAIDGHEVIRGKLAFLDMSGNFFGKYEGHKVNVSCVPFFGGSECTVYIDSETVGKF